MKLTQINFITFKSNNSKNFISRKDVANTQAYKIDKSTMLFEHDKNCSNIFHTASYETLENISRKMPPKQSRNLILKHDSTGSNAFHCAMFDKDKIQLFCSILTKAQIKECTVAENGFNISPLKNAPVENLEIMLDYLKEKDVADICLTHKYRNNNNIFHKSKAGRIELLSRHLDTKTIKQLSKSRNKDGDTPLHTLEKDSIKVLMKHLSQDDVREICTIKNQKGETPLDKQNDEIRSILIQKIKN